jgi:hypothetical protein
MAILNHGSTIRTADGGQSTTTIVTASNIGSYAAPTNATYFIGTTQNALNRASGAQTLTGVSIDGNAATVTNGVYTTGEQTIAGAKTFNSAASFSANAFLTGSSELFIGSYMSLQSSSTIMGMVGFNRKVSDGTIFNSSYAAYQLHNNTGTLNLQVYSSAGGFVGAHTFNSSGNVTFLGTVSAATDFRAPVFYDSNNTAYYIDPASTSVLNKINLNSAGVAAIQWRAAGVGTIVGGFPFYNNASYGSINIEVSDNDTGGLVIDNEGVTVYGAADNGQLFRTIDEDVYQTNGNNVANATTFWINQGADGGGTIRGSFTATTDFRAPIFYDSDNTAYYINAASTSIVNSFKVYDALYFGDYTTYLSQSTPYLRITTANGYGNFGPANSSWFHMTTDRPNFYMAVGLHVNGDMFIYNTQSQLTSTSVRAPIFYDSGDTTYYLDPANSGTSLLVAGKVGIGTTSPVAKLHVIGTSSTNENVGPLFVTHDFSGTHGYGIIVSRDNSTDTAALSLGADNGNNAIIAANNGDLRIGKQQASTLYEYVRISTAGNVGIGTTDFSYTINDNSRLVGSNTNNKLFINGSIQLLSNNDAIVIGRGTATFLSDEELGFGWGGGWYMTDGTYLRVRNDKVLYSAGEIWGSIFKDSNDTTYYLNPADVSYLYEPRMAYRTLIGAQSYDATLFETPVTTRPGVVVRGSYPHIEMVAAGIDNSTHGATLRFVGYDTGGATTGNFKHWVIGCPATNLTGLYFGYSPNQTNPHYGIGRGWSSGNDVSIFWILNDREVYAENGVRATIFYDRNNTSYYVDPASTSNLLGLTVANTITGSVSGNAATATNVAWTGITGGARTNYDLQFQPSAGGYSGFAFKTSSAGEAGYFLIRATSDTDVYTAEGITLVADAGWLTLAQRTTASKGVRIMTGTTSSERFKITTAGDVQIVNGNTFTYNGNVILHAANYNSYAPTLTGTGASGTWSINVTGNAATVTNGVYTTGDQTISGIKYFTSTVDPSTVPAGYAGGYILESTTGFGTYGIIFGSATGQHGAIGYSSNTMYFGTENGTDNTLNTKATLSSGGTFTANGDVRSPIFYDSNNTAYYVDAASTSILNTIRLAGKLTNNGSVADDDGFGIYWENAESTSYAIYREAGSWTNPFPDLRIAFHTGIKLGANAGYNGIRFYNDYTMATQVMSVNNSGDGLGADNVYVNNSLQAGSSLRAPIFYDSNNTAYYCDPNSTSNLYYIQMPYIANGSANILVNNGGSENWNAIKISGGNDQNGIGYSNTSHSAFGRNNLSFHVHSSDSIRLHSSGWDTLFEVAGSSGNAWLKGGLFSEGFTRLVNPGGAYYVTSTSSVTGAIKIRLPRLKVDCMMRMTVKIYQYNTGQCATIECGGYDYSGDGIWRNIFAYQNSDLFGTVNVRFGNDGTYDCVWIGETSSTWSYPQVFVTDFQAGYNNYTSAWGTGWSISYVTAFDTVTDTRVAYKTLNTSNVLYVGTTSIALNRSSASQTLTGVSIDGNSATTTLATKATRANGNFYIDDNYGNTVVGLYAASRYQGVFAMGDSYKLPADGTTTGNLYGIAWSHPNAGGAAGNLSTHGALILENGSYIAAISSSIRCTADMRTPIYYDSNNTAYYSDPGSTSRLVDINIDQGYTYGWWRNWTSGNGIYNQGSGQHFYSDDVSYWNVASSSGAQGIRFRTGGHAGTVRGYVYANDSNDVGLLNNAGNWRIRIVGGDYLLADGSSIRGQIFYDSNDTGYYVDPNSGSNLVSITNRENLPGGSGNTYYWSGSAMSFYWTKIANVGGGNTHAAILITYKTDVNYNPFGLALLSVSAFNSQTFSVKLEKLNGDSMQILIRVDNNNDVWLLTAAEWSSYKTWKVISKLGSPTIYYSSLTEQLTTPANSIEIASGQEVRGNQGAATSATVSTVANHLFGGLTVRSDVRAPIFYDSDDTAFYLDPAGTSNLNKFSTLTMSYNDMNSMHVNSPYVNRYNGSSLYRNGTMGYGTVDCNVMFSNWGSGFIDSWSSPANAPGGSTHYVGLQGFHYNHVNNSQAYGFQMLCAGEADNRFFWRSAWPNLRSWVEMIHSGNIGSQTVATAGSCTGNSATVTNGVYTTGDQSIGGAKTFTRINFGATGSTPYSSAAGEGFGNGITFGGDENSGYYRIFTTMENVGGNYSKLALNWHTGIRIGAYPNYGGVRFYNNAFGNGTEIFSVGSLDSNVRVVNTIYAQSFYDINNTAYYVDPNSTSNIVGLTVANTITGSVSGNAATVTNGVYTGTTNTLTGVNYFRSDKGSTSTVGTSNTYALQAFSNDAGAAGMSFHRGGYYAVNMGLDPDNILRIGGWSASANRLQLDMSGNLTVAGAMYGTNFIDSDNTAYFCNPASTSNLNGLTTASDITVNGITIGKGAGNNLTNSAFGINALSANTGNGNSAFGYHALRYNTTGFSNTGVGRMSLRSNTSGVKNTAVGRVSLFNNTTGIGNSAFGYDCAFSSTYGSYNSAFGTGALRSNTYGNNISCFGYEALRTATAADNSSAFGFKALRASTSFENSAFGSLSMTAVVGGSGNSAFGHKSLFTGTSFSSSSAFGSYALGYTTTGTQNSAFGTDSLRANTSGSYNCAFGRNSGRDATTGSYNSFFGYNTGRGITTGSNNTVIGSRVGSLSANLSNNIIIADGSGNKRISVDSSGNTVFSGIVDATQFRDSSNTAFLLDPASTSILNAVRTRNTYGERVSVTSAASTTIDTQYNLTELTMAAFITTLTFSNIQSSGTVHMWTIVTLGNGSATSVTWPAAIKWPGGTAPNITGTNTKRDIYQFVTYDGGTNIYAIIVGQNL